MYQLSHRGFVGEGGAGLVDVGGGSFSSESSLVLDGNGGVVIL